MTEFLAVFSPLIPLLFAGGIISFIEGKLLNAHIFHLRLSAETMLCYLLGSILGAVIVFWLQDLTTILP